MRKTVAQLERENGLVAWFIHMLDFATGKFSVVEGGRGGDRAMQTIR